MSKPKVRSHRIKDQPALSAEQLERINFSKLVAVENDGAAVPVPTPTNGAVPILVCTPVQYGQSYDDYWESLVNAMTVAAPQYHLQRCPAIGGCGVAKARNVQASYLLRGNWEIMLCWDNDIKLGPKKLCRLLSHFEDESIEVVGGMYPLRTHPPTRWVLSQLPGELTNPKTGLLEVKECGTGLKAIRRSAFIKQIKAFPEIEYTPDDFAERMHAWDFFSMGVVNGRYLSEDYYFDWRHRKVGGKVFVDTEVRAGHMGLWKFTGEGLPIPGYEVTRPGVNPAATAIEEGGK